MFHIGHLRDARHTFFPLPLRNLDLLQRYREVDAAVQFIDFLELLFLSVDKQSKQNAESYDFPVEMPFLDQVYFFPSLWMLDENQ